MSMVRLKVTIDSEILNEIASRLSVMGATNKNLPATAEAVEAAAKLVQATWKNYAIGRQSLDEHGVPPMKTPSRDYAEGVKIERPGTLEREIVNYSKVADYLENGTAEFDMKSKLDQYPRSRMTKGKKKKDGTWKEPPHPYLIVPFRWGTTPKKGEQRVGFRDVMPQVIYNIVKKAKFERSLVAQTTHNEPNAKGEDTDRWDYEKWGSRLKINQIIEADDGGMNINQMFNMSGMVSMDASSKDKKYSGYYTFRVMSSKSPPSSWIRPAMKARHVTDGIVKENEKEVNDLLDAAFRKDIGL
jgi:hypothetical protein